MRKIAILCILLILSLVFIIGVKGSFDGYYGFYYNNKEYTKPYLYSLSEKIIVSKAINIFTNNTGFDTGYGFFAPNVASDFILEFKLYDKEDQLIDQKIMPHFYHKESRIRYTTVFNMFLDKLEKNKLEGKYQQYLDIIIKQIGENIKSKTPEAIKVETYLYLYDYVRLDAFDKENAKEKLFLIAEFKN